MSNSIRKIALDAPGTFEQARLTDEQRRIVQWLRDNEPRSTAEAADAFEISVQSASVRLKELVKKGYLTRKKLNDPTGGVMYHYRIKPELAR